MKKTLYAKNSKGGIKVWKIEVVSNKNGTATIIIQNGILDGNMVTKKRIIKSGKNIGKANETTPLEQATKEAESNIQKKKDKDYKESLKEAKVSVSILPMLAHKFIDRKHYIKYPAIGQRKYDGVRCMITKAHGGFTFMSRGGKNFGPVLIKHKALIDTLDIFMKNGHILDGELYVHGWSLQRITAAVKKYRSDTLRLNFVIFDSPSIPGGFTTRSKILQTNKSKPPVIWAETVIIKSEEEVYGLHDEYVQEGYEGIIIRNADSLYQYGNRSNDLQKYKNFIDEEFEIVGTYKEVQIINDIKYECIEFNCMTKDGGPFNCRPRGTLEHRSEQWKNRAKYIGKQLTVRYFTLTDDTQGKGKKVPQFPVGIVVRDYE